jgi:hypothetical protein
MKLSELEDFLADAVFVSQEQSINTSANTKTIGNSLIFQANKTNSSNLLKYPEKTAIQTMTANEKNTMIMLIILIIVCLIFFVTLLNVIKVCCIKEKKLRIISRNSSEIENEESRIGKKELILIIA